MADSVNVSTIIDGPRKAVFYLTNISDSTGESAVTKIDVSALSTSADGDACTGVRIESLSFSTVGMGIQLLWNATANRLAIALPANYSDSFDFSAFSGLPNYSGSGKNGDVLLTTVGAGSGETYTLTITCIKEYTDL